MQPFDDRLSVETDSQNEEVITFLRHAHGILVGTEPAASQQKQALASVRQRLLETRQDTPEIVEAHSHRPPLLLVDMTSTPEKALLLPTRGTSSTRKGGWQRSFSLIAAALVAALVVGSLLTVLSTAKQSQMGTTPGGQAIYALSGGWMQKINIVDGSLLWKHRVSTQRQNYTTFTVAENGIVYITAQQKLFALKTSNGSLLWSKNIDGIGGARPIVGNNKLYLILWKDVAKYDNHTTLEAFNALSGKMLWQYERNGLLSSFAVLNDTIYVGRDLSLLPMNNTNLQANFYLLALRAADGSEQWHVHLDDPSLVSSSGGITVVNGKIYVEGNRKVKTGKADADFQSYIYAYSAGDGTFLWRSPVPGPGYAQVSFVEQNVVYVNSSNGLSALNEQNGRLLWTHTGGRLDGSYAFQKDKIFGAETRPDGVYLVEMNALNGAVIAQHRIKTQTIASIQLTPVMANAQKPIQAFAAAFIFTATLVSPNVTYMMTTLDNHLEAFSNTTGKRLWSTSLPGEPHPIILDLAA